MALNRRSAGERTFYLALALLAFVVVSYCASAWLS